MNIHAPFREGFRGFDPKSGQISLRPPKGNNGCKTRHLSYWALELLQKCDCSPAKKWIDMLMKKIHTKRVFHACATVQSRNCRIYSNEILYIESLAACSDIFKTASKLLQGFGRGRGCKILLFPSTLALASNAA